MDFVDLASKLNFLPNVKDTIRFSFSLVVGGVIGCYLRILYLRCSSSLSNNNLVSGIFPLLIVSTVCVIAVVKSSLALSLGLVGALSIVRFRTAIKDPEELVWLFICITVGVSLGAGQLLYAIAMTCIISIFVLGREFLSTKKYRKHKLLITISGDTDQFFKADNNLVMQTLDDHDGTIVIQRYDVDQEGGSVRVIVDNIDSQKISAFVDYLRGRLPGCDISYINMDSLV